MTSLVPAWARRHLRAWRPLFRAPCTARDGLWSLLHRLPWHPDWRFYGLPDVSNLGRMEIGRRFTACSISRCNSIGVLQRVILKTTTSAAVLRIGDEVGVSGCSISASERIEIADRVLIGSGCLITDSDAHPLDPAARRRNEPPRTAPIVIEEDVFIGARSIVLKGVRIGRGSVIGAGSVVARSIPAGVVAAGNPARVVRALAAESAAP